MTVSISRAVSYSLPARARTRWLWIVVAAVVANLMIPGPGSLDRRILIAFPLLLAYVSLALGGRTYQAKTVAAVSLGVYSAALGWSLSFAPVVAVLFWAVLILVMTASLAGKGAQILDMVDRRFRKTPAPADAQPWV